MCTNAHVFATRRDQLYMPCWWECSECYRRCHHDETSIICHTIISKCNSSCPQHSLHKKLIACLQLIDWQNGAEDDCDILLLIMVPLIWPMLVTCVTITPKPPDLCLFIYNLYFISVTYRFEHGIANRFYWTNRLRDRKLNVCYIPRKLWEQTVLHSIGQPNSDAKMSLKIDSMNQKKKPSN